MPKAAAAAAPVVPKPKTAVAAADEAQAAATVALAAAAKAQENNPKYQKDIYFQPGAQIPVAGQNIPAPFFRPLAQSWQNIKDSLRELTCIRQKASSRATSAGPHFTRVHVCLSVSESITHRVGVLLPAAQGGQQAAGPGAAPAAKALRFAGKAGYLKIQPRQAATMVSSGFQAHCLVRDTISWQLL